MGRNKLKFYETTFIVDSLLEDDKVDAIINRYNTFFSKNGAEVLKVEKWGRRKLAYPIKKRTAGSYITFEVNADPSVMAKLERAYHLDDDVLRFLTIAFDKKTLADRQVYLEKKEQLLKEREAQSSQSAEETEISSQSESAE
ncbi:MAG: 30S ribosomal protein S6 [Ignavibacteria bacterium]|nr:30S ribosomal protein S6 [Ignavibacteria bacterium]